MTNTPSHRTLKAIFELGAEDQALSGEKHAVDELPLPTVDERIGIYSRAVHGPDYVMTAGEREALRDRILDAMADEAVHEILERERALPERESTLSGPATDVPPPYVIASLRPTIQARLSGLRRHFARSPRDARMLAVAFALPLVVGIVVLLTYVHPRAPHAPASREMAAVEAVENLSTRGDLTPGAAEPIPADKMASATLADVGASSPIWAREALLTKFKDDVPRTRGPGDILLFRATAPSVVLIITKDGIGSGSVLKNNVILTSLHVVGPERRVTVVFKPSDPNGKLADDEVSTADVIKVDRQRDLALLRPKSVPSRPIHPLDLSSQDTIEVGSDVFAIGHPKREVWTFTKGIVSQFRPDYEWSAGPGKDQYRATVIQTQTPINAGNSGGPLLSEDGKIVGVNAFKDPDTEGLNFAIAASEVRSFLSNPKNDLLPRHSCNVPKTIFEGRNRENSGFLRLISLQCDNKADIIIFAGDDRRKPIVAYLDLKRRGKIEGIVFDLKRNGKWDFSYWDVKFDDTFAVKGLHPDGKLMPSRYEPRCPPGSIALPKFKCSQT